MNFIHQYPQENNDVMIHWVGCAAWEERNAFPSPEISE
jgi:hypothetical protein